ncbi:MAG: thioredoxin [Elusimicrobiota bacterium]
MASVNVVELNNDNFDKETTAGVCLIDFWAPWCGPCKMLGPVIDELAGELVGKVKVCKVNVDDAGEIASRFNVQAVPTMIILKDGKIAEQLVGAQPKDSILEAINTVL